jgi:SAM-dependent methyltransferase
MTYPCLSDLHDFYKTPLGQYCQYFLGKYIKVFSSSTNQNGIIGYGTPYVSSLPSLLFSAIPSQQGINFLEEKHSLCLVSPDLLPLKEYSLDFLLIIHCFEFHEYPLLFLKEIWRILKAEGTVVIVIPHFLSYWSKNLDNPFSLGKHYSSLKIKKWLKEAHFTLELTQGLFHFPSINNGDFLSQLKEWEKFSQRFLPFLENVTLYKVKKKIPAFLFPPQIPSKIIPAC